MMSKRDKLRERLRNNPKGVKFTDLETLLRRFGFRLVRVKGSHHFFEYGEGNAKAILVIPVHANEVKPVYVKDTIALLDELFEETLEVEDSEDEQDS